MYPLGRSSFILLAAALLLSGCSFHLREAANLPFDTLYVQAPSTSQFATQLRRAVAAGSQTKIADNSKDAAATLLVLSEVRQKQILSLSTSGRVSEFRLLYRVSYRLIDNKNKDILPQNEILLRRDFAFNDQQVLSKESEEALLYRDMQTDAVRQLVRRLQATSLNAKS
jgi:LPS-assembly lipoprotein